MPPSVLLEKTPAGPSFRPSSSRKWLWQVGLLFSLLPLGRWSRTAVPAAVAAVPARAVPAWHALFPFSIPLVATQPKVEELPVMASSNPAVPCLPLPIAGL